MNLSPYIRHSLFAILIFMVSACTSEKSPDQKGERPSNDKTAPTKPSVSVPDFSGQNALAYVQKQVDFGPRVPGTAQHKACGEWLVEELGKYTQASTQTGTVSMSNGATFPMTNIIGQYQPEKKRRVLLCAHWDTRPVADQDSERRDEPILGANDAGSGVGVLLEIARILADHQLTIGVDFVLFDIEDSGLKSEDYCLGSKYWAKNAKRTGYQAEYGILLDMVGGKGAVFNQEGYSRTYANHIIKKVWGAANTAGYSSYFTYDSVAPITDDHLYVNQITGIPTIDIIEYDSANAKGFGDFWHTHDDNMDIMDATVLQAVGQTVLQVLFEE